MLCLAVLLASLAVGRCVNQDEEISRIKLLPGELLCNCSFPGCREGDVKGVCLTTGGCMKTLAREGDRLIAIYACIQKEQYIPIERPLACETHKLSKHLHVIGCCRNESFCNGKLNLKLEDPPVKKSAKINANTESGTPLWRIMVLVLVPAVVVCLIIFGYLFVRCRFWETKWKHLYEPGYEIDKKDTQLAPSIGPFDPHVRIINSLLDEVDIDSSGSGSGHPIFVQRTIARQIELQLAKPVGTGRFGEVWLGLWHGEKVAVKIFHSYEEKSWFREVEIFQTNMLHHENILAFIGSDNKDTGISTQLWLVTQFHKNGSLFDYLSANVISPQILCRMARSIANGLAFLHLEVTGTHCKPSIAHRDLKSKNVLVKDDFSCCIADLGMAVRYSENTLDKPLGSRVGTRRYLAPEILDGSMNEQQFDSYRRADIYALGLMLWEMANRTIVDDVCIRPYELPYYDSVAPDPSMEEMKRVVCDLNKRPDVPSTWNSHKVLNGISKLMRECWTQNASARLTALRVKKSVDSLSSSLPEVNA